MARRWTDYNGPVGLYAAVNGELRPLSDPRALLALTDSALLTGLGYSDKAAAYERVIRGRMTADSVVQMR